MTSSYINQLLFRENRINNSNDISLFEPFMLTRAKKDLIIKEIHSINKINENKEYETKEKYIQKQNDSENKKQEYEGHNVSENKKQEKYKEDLIYIKQTDSLFWCLFIIAHGYKEYHMVGRNYGVKELEEKKKIYEFVKSNPTRLKSTNYKITNVAIQEIMSELIVVQKKTSYLCMIAMLVYYNVNLIIVNPSKKSMIEFWIDKEENDLSKETSDTFVIYKDNHNNYKLQVEKITSPDLHLLKETMMSWEHFEKPMRGMSSYKVVELNLLMKKLGLFVEGKKYKKEEMYELLQTMLV